MATNANMTPEELTLLMLASKTESEWNANCDLVKLAGGGHYPSFWYPTIILGGVYAQVSASWPK